jgi:hypothetical protein
MTNDEIKLDMLAEAEGYNDPLDMCRDAMMDGTCPGICMNADCDATFNYEPDQDKGFCEECGTNTVKSGLLLAGLI